MIKCLQEVVRQAGTDIDWDLDEHAGLLCLRSASRTTVGLGIDLWRRAFPKKVHMTLDRLGLGNLRSRSGFERISGVLVFWEPATGSGLRRFVDGFKKLVRWRYEVS
jgi:hypothetical protein